MQIVIIECVIFECQKTPMKSWTKSRICSSRWIYANMPKSLDFKLCKGQAYSFRYGGAFWSSEGRTPQDQTKGRGRARVGFLKKSWRFESMRHDALLTLSSYVLFDPDVLNSNQCVRTLWVLCVNFRQCECVIVRDWISQMKHGRKWIFFLRKTRRKKKTGQGQIIFIRILPSQKHFWLQWLPWENE